MIVPPSPPVVAGFFDDLLDVLFALLLGHVKLEPFAELLQAAVTALEAWEVDTRDDGHLDERDDLLGVRPERHETLEHVLLEFTEELAALPTENVNVLLGELEASLEVQVAGTIGKHEAEIDVDHMATRV